jgi:hypothetical protein
VGQHDLGLFCAPRMSAWAWVGEASVLAGGFDFTWKLATRVEQTSTSTDLSPHFAQRGFLSAVQAPK